MDIFIYILLIANTIYSSACTYSLPVRDNITFVRIDKASDDSSLSALIQPLLNKCAFNEQIHVFNYGLCFEYCENEPNCLLMEIGIEYESCRLCLHSHQNVLNDGVEPKRTYFILEELQEVFNHCRRVECQNGASCVSEQGSYNCICQSGFTGDLCETNINECETVVCDNGGACLDQINGYQCECAAGFTGDTCQSEIGSCASVSCGQNRRCFEHGSSCYVFDDQEQDWDNANAVCSSYGFHLVDIATVDEGELIVEFLGQFTLKKFLTTICGNEICAFAISLDSFCSEINHDNSRFLEYGVNSYVATSIQRPSKAYFIYKRTAILVVNTSFTGPEIDYTFFWTAARRTDNDNWQWYSTGSPIIDAVWHSGELSGSYDCARIYGYNGLLYNGYCNYARVFICEYP